MAGLKDKKLFLLDLDGTIYLGDKLFDGTLDFLDWVRCSGGKYYFLTNNSSKSIPDNAEKLIKMGIPAASEDFVTSAQVTARYLALHYKNKKIYVLGTKSLQREFASAGLDITDKLDDNISCLVMGFDTELTFTKMEDACKLLNAKVDYIATNPDLVCPTEYGFVPDCGSVAGMLFNATGRLPKYIGKPKPEIVEFAIQKSGLKKEQTLLIGDRLYTDIACGLNAGVDTALVLSGETSLEDLEKSEYKPMWVFEDIKEILNSLQNE